MSLLRTVGDLSEHPLGWLDTAPVHAIIKFGKEARANCLQRDAGVRPRTSIKGLPQHRAQAACARPRFRPDRRLISATLISLIY